MKICRNEFDTSNLQSSFFNSIESNDPVLASSFILCSKTVRSINNLNDKGTNDWIAGAYGNGTDL